MKSSTVAAASFAVLSLAIGFAVAPESGAVATTLSTEPVLTDTAGPSGSRLFDITAEEGSWSRLFVRTHVLPPPVGSSDLTWIALFNRFGTQQNTGEGLYPYDEPATSLDPNLQSQPNLAVDAPQILSQLNLLGAGAGSAAQTNLEKRWQYHPDATPGDVAETITWRSDDPLWLWYSTAPHVMPTAIRTWKPLNLVGDDLTGIADPGATLDLMKLAAHGALQQLPLSEYEAFVYELADGSDQTWIEYAFNVRCLEIAVQAVVVRDAAAPVLTSIVPPQGNTTPSVWNPTGALPGGIKLTQRRVFIINAARPGALTMPPGTAVVAGQVLELPCNGWLPPMIVTFTVAGATYSVAAEPVNFNRISFAIPGTAASGVIGLTSVSNCFATSMAPTIYSP